jgi:hypothetical protein
MFMRIKQPRFELEITGEAASAFTRYQDWFAVDGDQNADTSAASDVVLSLHLDPQTQRFFLNWQNSSAALKLDVQCASFVESLSRGLATKQGPLNQALGKKTRRIFDATGGWGNDSMLFASQGMVVTTVERNPILAMMLHQAMSTLPLMFEGSSFSNNTFPEIHFGSADQVYKQLKEGSNSDTADVFDCAYFDPMFPPKRKKSAKSNKQMQFAQTLLQGDPDAADIAASLLEQGVRRLVVKRPSYAAVLLPNVEQTFSAKLVDYDVYLNF